LTNLVAGLIEAGERRTNAAEELQALLDAAVDAIIVISDSGIVEAYNPSAERLFGYTEEEILGQNVHTLMPSPYREEHDHYLARYVTTGLAKIIGIGVAAGVLFAIGAGQLLKAQLFGVTPVSPLVLAVNVIVDCKVPSAAITRWQGTTIPIGFAPFAAPTARTASVRHGPSLPIA